MNQSLAHTLKELAAKYKRVIDSSNSNDNVDDYKWRQSHYINASKFGLKELSSTLREELKEELTRQSNELIESLTQLSAIK